MAVEHTLLEYLMNKIAKPIGSVVTVVGWEIVREYSSMKALELNEMHKGARAQIL